MGTVSAIIAVASLLAAVAFAPVVGGVLFSIVLVGAFFLALVGAIAGTGDRTVRQHEPSMDPRGWRNGS